MKGQKDSDVMKSLKKRGANMKKNSKPTEKKTPKVVKYGNVIFKELPLYHPVYSEGIIIGGRITRNSLEEESKKKESKN